MTKTKEEHLLDLVDRAFRLDDRVTSREEKTTELQLLAQMARQGLKDTPEFKNLKREADNRGAFDIGNEVRELRGVVKRLRKYRWD